MAAVHDDSHYIGVDVGTGSARACIIDSNGEIKGLAEKTIRQWRPQAGYYEQSTVDIWRAVCHCVRAVVASSKVPLTSVRGMGFDATCSLAVLDRETDEPVCVTAPSFAHSPEKEDDRDLVRNVILWLDHRPMAEAEAINDTRHPLLKYVGGAMNVEMEMPKVLWLKRNMPPENWDKCSFWDLADALAHIATGGRGNRQARGQGRDRGEGYERSFCSTACKQGYVPVGADGCVKGWQPDFYHHIGLEEIVQENFERMGGVDGVNGRWLSAGEPVGLVSEKAAEEMGLLPGVVTVGSGVIDAYAGWIATVGAKVQLDNLPVAAAGESMAFTRLAAVAGTSTCFLAMSKDPIFVPGVWGPYNNVVLPDLWMAEGGQSATGALIEHVLTTHPARADADAEAARGNAQNIYDHLNNHLEAMRAAQNAPSISYLARHIFFYGDLWGNRSPLSDPHMRGSLTGMTPDTNIDNLALMYYVTIEFIALQTRQIVSTMNQAGHKLSSIFASGSQCRNPVLMELIATACDMPIVIPEYVSAAVVHGAAMLGAKAARPKEGLWEIMTRMTRPGTVTQPGTNKGVRELLGVKYEILLMQMEAQRTYRDLVDKALVTCEPEQPAQ